jgi:hypothetical protein
LLVTGKNEFKKNAPVIDQIELCDAAEKCIGMIRAKLIAAGQSRQSAAINLDISNNRSKP